MSRLYVDRISPYQSASVTVDGLDTSNLTTKTSFNSYTSSNDAKVTSLINATGSYAGTGVANTFTAGPQLISGSNGFATQTFDIPGTNQEKKFFDVKGANINGDAYNRVFQGFADYPSFGDAYKDYFAIEYYNSTSYNFGSEFAVNGIITTLSTIASGSNAANGARFRTQDNGDGTSTASVRGNTINIGTNAESNNVNISNGTNKANIQGVLNISAQDPLPSGVLGDLSVSGSALYFHNGSSWGVIS